jgi:hypothetical protein
MPIIATPARRRMVMIALLSLAVSGAVIRHFAANPSVLRDVGTLLLVMWLPAVGNLIAYLIRKLPRKAPQVRDFPAGSAFSADLQVRASILGVAPELLAALNPRDDRCTVLAGQQGFSARLAMPLAQAFAQGGEQILSLQLLRPEVALRELTPGTDIHLLVGTTAAASGRILQAQ